MTAISPAAIAAIENAALARGDTRVLMMPHQLVAHDIVRNLKPVEWAFLRWSRRGGKTWFCVEQVFDDVRMMPPNSTIRYACPSKVHARDFVLPTFEQVGDRIPPSMRPRFDVMRNTYFFPNGTRVVIGSCETRRDCEVQKGTSCHRAIVEEAGVIDPSLLRYVIAGVLEPQFATTRGSGIIVGTPPEHDLPDHEYWVRFAQADVAGIAHTITIDDLPHVDEDMKAALVEKAGGRQNPRARREYFVERCSENDLSILPEWQVVMKECTEAREVPPWKQWYCVGDLGFNDLSAIVWAWLDFQNAQIVVRHELSGEAESGLSLGHRALALEKEHGITDPLRYADGTLQLRADMADTKHGPGIVFGLPPKDDFDAAINQLRMLIARKKIVVDPSCTTLLAHMKHGTWNERRTEFSRVPGFGHWDFIAALLYLSRVVDWRANPEPLLVEGQSQATHFVPVELTREASRRKHRNREAFR